MITITAAASRLNSKIPQTPIPQLSKNHGVFLIRLWPSFSDSCEGTWSLKLTIEGAEPPHGNYISINQWQLTSLLLTSEKNLRTVGSVVPLERLFFLNLCRRKMAPCDATLRRLPIEDLGHYRESVPSSELMDRLASTLCEVGPSWRLPSDPDLIVKTFNSKYQLFATKYSFYERVAIHDIMAFVTWRLLARYSPCHGLTYPVGSLIRDPNSYNY